MDSLITAEQFYRGKTVTREEWFVNDLDRETWARLRVFDDKTSDVWDHGELFGFDGENHARSCISEGHYVSLDHLKQIGWGEPKSKPPVSRANEPSQPFKYYGLW